MSIRQALLLCKSSRIVSFAIRDGISLQWLPFSFLQKIHEPMEMSQQAADPEAKSKAPLYARSRGLPGESSPPAEHTADFGNTKRHHRASTDPIVLSGRSTSPGE